ncbi:ABC transporter ATP-binding protein [Collibacillus ludicampi]|uniref:ABC transporter ATP-binding protein n=1 Tax=Collibacillus ludicampi TaxID=2771369 RepID=UPI0024953951|nr:ABC transporter ATP-binding protein [Collibacillus ludicampi]
MIDKDKVMIDVKGVSKTYKLYENPIDRLKESIHPFKKKYHKEFHALKDISFQVKMGDTLGIIGRNGSGKSTLLKLITGILQPTSGTISVNGKIAALLELGAGFNLELTGIENIYLYGTIMGLSKQEIDKKLDEIIEFADIGDFIFQPVKMYSSGMFARLAFSVAINVDPDILIVDETLSVGDAYFTAKCMEKIREWVNSRTVIFVSHSLEVVRSFCNKGILLDQGRIHTAGDIQMVTETYERLINQQIVTSKLKSIAELAAKPKLEKKDMRHNQISKELSEDPEFTRRVSQFRSGTGHARFIRAEALVDSKPTHIIPFGEEVVFRLVAEYYSDIDTEGTVGYMVRNRNGQDVFGMNIFNLNRLLPPIKKGTILEVEFTFKNILAPGSYSVSLGLKPKPIEPIFLDCVNVAIFFEVPPLEGQNYVPGLLYVPNELTYNIVNLNIKESVASV